MPAAALACTCQLTLRGPSTHVLNLSDPCNPLQVRVMCSERFDSVFMHKTVLEEGIMASAKLPHLLWARYANPPSFPPSTSPNLFQRVPLAALCPVPTLTIVLSLWHGSLVSEGSQGDYWDAWAEACFEDHVGLVHSQDSDSKAPAGKTRVEMGSSRNLLVSTHCFYAHTEGQAG